MTNKNLPECEFCGTRDKAHNVKPKYTAKQDYLLCDNPVCNAIPGLTEEPHEPVTPVEKNKK